MGRRIALVAILLLALGSSLPALELESLQGDGASLHWSAPQFIGADAQGHVFLLRGVPLEVYPVTKRHELGEPSKLAATTSNGPPLMAAMSPRGDWLVALGVELHLFAYGKETALPALPWFPAGVAFLRGDPVALVVAPRLVTPDRQDDGPPPVLLRLGGDSWSAELREARQGSPADVDEDMLHRAVRVLDLGEGRYALARRYAYRIEERRLGRDRPLAEVQIGRGEPLRSKTPEADTRRLVAEAKARGMDLAHVQASGFHGANAILALAASRVDRRLLVLDGSGVAGDRCALDRVDWDRRRLERIPLDLPCEGQVSMAAGRDGLYFARFNGEAGRYFVSWDALETAPWKAVPDARFTP